jgi:hypothetical protein
VINDHPINRRLTNADFRLLGVGLPVSTQPTRMSELYLPWLPVGISRHGMNDKTTLPDQIYQVARMGAANKVATRIVYPQLFSQRQATHDVAGANMERGVGAEDYR